MASETSIMRVPQLLLGDFGATVGRRGLMFARYEALVLLAFSRQGQLSMSKIEHRLMVHPTSVTNIVHRLVGQALVERRPNPADGRGMLAMSTPRGREVMEAATNDLVAAGFSLGGSTNSSSPCWSRCVSRPVTSSADLGVQNFTGSGDIYIGPPIECHHDDRECPAHRCVDVRPGALATEI